MGILLPSPSPDEDEETAPGPSTVVLLREAGILADDPMSEAGRKTLRFHFRRMLYNEPGTREGEDIEALHDMRVATRRMRSAFRVFGKYYRPKKIEPYLRGLKYTGRALGAVRDLDVFGEKVRSYIGQLPPSQQSSMDGFLAALKARHEKARGKMLVYLDSGKYRRFVAGFGEFVETEGLHSRRLRWKGEDPLPYRVSHVAPPIIYQRLAAVRAYDEWVTVPQPPLERLHSLRIACKRLRYTLEFFREVLGPDTGPAIREVVTMQDHLGELQDAVVASGILRDFLVWGTWGRKGSGKGRAELDAPVVAPGVTAYLATQQAELQHLLETFPRAWQRLVGPEFSRMIAEAVIEL
jgi:CHAD domain-containing protein